MTQLPSNPFAERIRERVEARRAKRQRFQSLFEQAQSARQPYEGPERRATERVTLEDLEAMTESELGQRLAARQGPEDERSGFVKFFDLLDLPRNLIAQAVIRPFLEPDEVAGARKATFGLPQITFSQALGEAGMEPGFARSAVGFVGDLVTDPLTYLGAGAAAKIGMKAGSVGIRKGTSKTLDRTLRSIAQAGAFEPQRLPGRVRGLEGTLGRAARPSVLAAARKRGMTPGQIEVMLREAILGRVRTPGVFDATSKTIKLTPTEIAKRIARGETFAPEQLAANPRLKRIVESIERVRGKYAQRTAQAAGQAGDQAGIAGKTKGGLRVRDLAEGAEADDVIRQQRLAARIRKAVKRTFKEPVSIPTTRQDNLLTPYTQPGLIARRVGQDPGIADFLKREAVGRGLAFHLPFTDIGVNVVQMDRRLRALRAGDINPFLEEIGEAGTGFQDTILQRVSKGIRGAEKLDEKSPASLRRRVAIANGITAVDRNLQKFFGYGNRVSAFAQTARITENLKSAEFAAAESRALQLSNEVNSIAAEAGGPEIADRVRETIIAQLEIGMARAKDPGGKALYGAADNSRSLDLTNVSAENAAEMAGRIRQAKQDAERLNLPWDEILDRVADGLEDGMWFNPRLQEFVRKNQRLYNSIEESAVKGGLLEDGLPSFFARTPTEEAAAALRERRLQEPIPYGHSKEAHVLYTQGFQRHRTMNLYTWFDEAEKKRYTYYGYQLADDPIAQAKVKSAINAGLVPEAGYQTSIFHVNRLAQSGQLDSLLGGGWTQKLFAEDPAMALASNYRQAQRAKIGRDFEEYISRFARTVGKDKLNQFEGNKLIESIKGTGAYRVMTNALLDDAGNVIANQGDIIRQLRLDSDHPLFKSLGDGKKMFFDDRIATRIEEYADFYRDPGKISQFLGLFDGVVKQLRAITLAHPSWMLTNTVSNTISAALLGAGPQHVPLLGTAFNLYGKYQRFLRQGIIDSPEFERFLADTVEISGRTYRVGDIIRVAESTGVLEQGRILRELVNAASNSREALATTASIPGTGRLGKIYTRGMGKWFMTNHSIEQRQRLFGMMVRLAHGDTMQDAAATTIRHFFDYGDFTRFETDFMRKLFYFYPWVRNNAPFMVTKLFEDPKWAAAFPKLKVAFEEAIEDEQRIPENQRPQWFRDQMGFQVASRAGFMLPMLTQFQDVAEVGQMLSGKYEDAREFLHYLTSQLNPVFQLPFELAQGREFFTGREIGDKDLGQIGVGEFISGQLRPVAEARRIAQAKTPGEVFGRAIVGGRYQRLDPERAVRGEVAKLAEEASRVRNQINRAREDGDQARAVRLAVRLDRTWRKILEIDPESDRVPDRVKERLATSQAGR